MQEGNQHAQTECPRFLPGGRRHLRRPRPVSLATDDPQIIAAVVANNEAQDAALGDRVETLLRTDIGLAGSRIRVSVARRP